MPHRIGPPNEIGDASGDPRVIVRASRVVASLAILGPCARFGRVFARSGAAGGSARARPPVARDARPSSTADPARAKGCASAVGRRARGPGAGVCRRKARATFQLDFYDLTRDLPRFQRALFSGEHDLPSPTPGWVVLVCKSSCVDLKNTLNEYHLSNISSFTDSFALNIFFDRLVVDASPTCLPCYEIQQKLHLAEYGRAESMTHTQVRASRSLLRHSFVALPTGRGGALSPPPPPGCRRRRAAGRGSRHVPRRA